MRLRKIAASCLLAAGALSLAACNSGTGHHPGVSASHSAQASAAASAVAPIINTCLGKIHSPLGVVDLALSKGARQDFGRCLAIPPQNQNAFLGAVAGALNDYRKQVKGMSSDQKAAAHQQLLVTLSGLAARYQHVPPLAPGQTAAPSGSPSAKASATASASPAGSPV